MGPKKEITFANTKLVLKGVIIALSLSINQAAAYLAVFLWKLEFPYYLIIVFVLTLISSSYIKNLTKSIAFTVISVFVGVIIGLGILLIPPAIFGSNVMIEYTITFYLLFTSKLAIFNSVISVFSSILGSLLSGGA